MKKLLGKVFNKMSGSTLHSRLKTITSNEFLEVSKNDIALALSQSWQNPSVPLRQYEACTKNELVKYKNGIDVEPFDVLIDILRNNIESFDNKKLLEIGCSSGYYSEVLKIKGIGAMYSGCDYSGAFIEFARKLFPGIDFQVQDACSLTYADESFDIVVSGCCLLHIRDYEKAIEETARVAKNHVVFHRTPVLHKRETSYYIKTAYGVKMFEIHFNERELLGLMKRNKLRIMDIITFNACIDSMGDFYAYKTYMCEKT